MDGNRKANVSGRKDSHWVQREGRVEEKVSDDILSPMRSSCLSSVWVRKLPFLIITPHLTCSSISEFPFLQPKDPRIHQYAAS